MVHRSCRPWNTDIALCQPAPVAQRAERSNIRVYVCRDPGAPAVTSNHQPHVTCDAKTCVDEPAMRAAITFAAIFAGRQRPLLAAPGIA